ncbi:hypothetical protein BH92_15380 [Rhodococcoides fascians A21d2]|uniref:hypothetical protein n=1 Tax=Rhodococcoides fascians TaxID=1828 RepID=UPI0005634E1B|nr:hypothetical protein [Rhodococcus fascians]QII01071.1 hypothetical protein BH92_15380 [Rhodococcus fascians A21d2]
MSIAEFKQLVVDELEAKGVTIYAGGIRKQEPPYVQLYPAEDFIEVVNTSIGTNEYNIRVRFDLTIIAGPEDRDMSFDYLSELVKKCMDVVRNLDDVSCKARVFIDANGGRNLGANIAFSNELNINEGDL